MKVAAVAKTSTSQQIKIAIWRINSKLPLLSTCLFACQRIFKTV